MKATHSLKLRSFRDGAKSLLNPDFFAFVLAKQEECPLITGDAQLRNVAEA